MAHARDRSWSNSASRPGATGTLVLFAGCSRPGNSSSIWILLDGRSLPPDKECGRNWSTAIW